MWASSDPHLSVSLDQLFLQQVFTYTPLPGVGLVSRVSIGGVIISPSGSESGRGDRHLQSCCSSEVQHRGWKSTKWGAPPMVLAEAWKRFLGEGGN